MSLIIALTIANHSTLDQQNDLNNGGDSKGEKDRWNKYGDGSGWSNLYDQNEFDNDREKNGVRICI